MARFAGGGTRGGLGTTAVNVHGDLAGDFAVTASHGNLSSRLTIVVTQSRVGTGAQENVDQAAVAAAGCRVQCCAAIVAASVDLSTLRQEHRRRRRVACGRGCLQRRQPVLIARVTIGSGTVLEKQAHDVGMSKDRGEVQRREAVGRVATHGCRVSADALGDKVGIACRRRLKEIEIGAGGAQRLHNRRILPIAGDEHGREAVTICRHRQSGFIGEELAHTRLIVRLYRSKECSDQAHWTPSSRFARRWL